MAISTFKGLKSEVTKQLNRLIAEELMAEGKRLVELAVRDANFRNRTFNLRKSIGCCLYHNGIEYASQHRGGNYGREVMPKAANEEFSRYYSESPEPPEGPEGNKIINGEVVRAWDCLDKFFDEYKAPKGKWQLVIVAAMPYASFVENKGYKVVNFINTEMAMSECSARYGGKVKDLIDSTGLLESISKWW